MVPKKISNMKTFAISFLCSPSKRRKNGESLIEASISVNGERVYIQTQKSCRPEVFKKSMRSNSVNDIKKYTDTIRQRINEIQTNLLIQDVSLTARRIRDAIEGRDVKKSPSYRIRRQTHISNRLHRQRVSQKP